MYLIPSFNAEIMINQYKQRYPFDDECHEELN